jgi:hypothetical protein
MNLKYSHYKVWIAALLAAGGAGSLEAQETNRVDPGDFSAFRIINERNIFDPNRRPRLARPVQSAPQAPRIVDTFSLVGTMSYSNVLLAFFDGTSSEYRKSLAVGGRIGNYTAAEIHHNKVKLTSGTNDVDLKVGMQMRRSEDGTWTAMEAPATSFASAFENRGRGDRNDRRSGFNRRDSRSGSAFGSSGSSSAPTETLAPNLDNLDPTDPVARLMLRRMQEEGIALPGSSDAAAPDLESQSRPRELMRTDDLTNQETNQTDQDTNPDQPAQSERPDRPLQQEQPERLEQD